MEKTGNQIQLQARQILRANMLSQKYFLSDGHQKSSVNSYSTPQAQINKHAY